MDIRFLNAEKFIDGIDILAEELSINISKNALYTIELKEINDDKLIVNLKDNYATVSFKEKSRLFRGLAYIIDCFKNNVKEKEVLETPLLKTNGAMFDMSRNAVMNTKSVKLLLRKMALMGLNTFMLYTEDTYEVDGYPYFGHLRGRYTKEELKDLDSYALKLGIELIPCIQTLGHLETLFKWPDSARFKDSTTTLLVGSDETYNLLDAMFKTISQCFTTKRVHVGMDETFDLGTGKYLEKNGYKPRDDIFFEQMATVKELADKYNLKPMMWSDMIFRLAGKDIPNYADYHRDVVFTPEVIAKIPEGVQPVFWDYYNEDESWFDINIKKHQATFNEQMIFAGGISLWCSFCPLYSVSLKSTIPALNALKKNNAKEVFTTVWLNGSEACHLMALAGLAWYASFDYCGSFDEDKIRETFKISCCGNYDDMLLFEIPEKAVENSETCSRALVYSDPLLGSFDYHFSLSKEYYKKVLKTLKNTNVADIFKPATDTIIALSDALIHKGDFGLRLTKAYKGNDKKALNELIKECDVIIEKITVLKNAHRTYWFEYNKTLGWEIHDIRYGGIINRFDTVKLLLKDYLDGKIDKIEDLEQPRLPYSTDVLNAFRWSQYEKFATFGNWGY